MGAELAILLDLGPGAIVLVAILVELVADATRLELVVDVILLELVADARREVEATLLELAIDAGATLRFEFKVGILLELAMGFAATGVGREIATEVGRGLAATEAGRGLDAAELGLEAADAGRVVVVLDAFGTADDSGRDVVVALRARVIVRGADELGATSTAGDE